MKVSFEIPIPHLEEFSESTDYDFVLAHMLSHPTYRSFYSNRRELDPDRLCILDSGMYETDIIPEDYAVSVGLLSPQIVILPDVWCDAFGTVQASLRFLQHLPHVSTFTDRRYMFVLQGQSVEEVVSCFREFEHHISQQSIFMVTDIGVPLGIACGGADVRKADYDVTDLVINGRFEVIKALRSELIEAGLIVHLLSSANPRELGLYREMDFIERVDTGAPWTAAMHGIRYDEKTGEGRKLMKSLDIHREFVGEELELARHNIEVLRRFAKE